MTRKIGRILIAAALCVLTLMMTACGEQKFKHGTVSGTTYTSKFLGLKADFGSGCTFITDDMLAKALGIPDMSSDNVQTAFDKTGSITEMSVILAGGDSVDITIHDSKKTGAPVGDEYFDLAKQHLSEENIPVTIGTVNFLGKAPAALNTALQYSEKQFMKR